MDLIVWKWMVSEGEEVGSRGCQRIYIFAPSVDGLVETVLASWTVAIGLAQRSEVQRGSCMLIAMIEKGAAESTMSAGLLAASAQLLGSGSTGRRQIDCVAHIRHPMFPRHRLSSALVPPLLTLQPVAHSCAVYRAVVLLSAPVSPPVNGCPDFARPVLASRQTTSSVRLCLVSTARPALGIGSLHSCPRMPSRPPAAALFFPGTPHVFSLSAVQSARAS